MPLTDVGPEDHVADQEERAWAMAFSPPKGALLDTAEKDADATSTTTRLRVQQFAEVS